MLLRRRLLFALLAVTAPVALVMLVAAPGHAAEPLSLTWKAPGACPTREAVLTEVRRLLGGKIESATPVTARAEITLVGPAKYLLEIAIERNAAERPRAVVAPTCAELGDAAALILALAIDPAAVAGATASAAPSIDPKAQSSSPAAGTPAASPPTATGTLSPSLPRPQTGTLSGAGRAPETGTLPPTDESFDPVKSAASPRVFRLLASIAADAGTFREPTPILRLGAAFSAMPLRLEATAVLAFGGRIPAMDSPTKGGEFWLAGGALAGCYERRVGTFDGRPVNLAGCAGLEVDAMVGASYGVTQPDEAAAPWVAPLATGLLRWPLSRALALRLDLSIGAPVARPAFVIHGVGVVYQTGEVIGRAGAGLELDL